MRTSIHGWLLVLAAILFLGAPSSAGARSSRSTKAKRTLEGVVNLNTASAEELTLLPGIGPVVAQRIVEARAQKPFERSWELTRVKGIGSKLYRKVEDHVQTTGETTLRWREPQRSPTTNRSRSRRKGPKIIVFQQPQKPVIPAKTEASDFVGPPPLTGAAAKE